MAGEYLETDIDGLGRLALIVDDFYKAEDPKARIDLMREIRLQEARFGLTPQDRARLHWEIAKGEEAQDKRKPRPGTPSQNAHAADPRGILGVVK